MGRRFADLVGAGIRIDPDQRPSVPVRPTQQMPL